MFKHILTWHYVQLLQFRNRTCDNPPPSNGGDDCPGNSEETTTCSPGVAVCPCVQTGTGPTTITCDTHAVYEVYTGGTYDGSVCPNGRKAKFNSQRAYDDLVEIGILQGNADLWTALYNPHGENSCVDAGCNNILVWADNTPFIDGITYVGHVESYVRPDYCIHLQVRKGFNKRVQV